MQEFLEKLEKARRKERMFEYFEGWKRSRAIVLVSKNPNGITITRIHIPPQEKTEKRLERFHYIIRFSKRKKTVILRSASNGNAEPIQIHTDEISQVG